MSSSNLIGDMKTVIANGPSSVTTANASGGGWAYHGLSLH